MWGRFAHRDADVIVPAPLRRHITGEIVRVDGGQYLTEDGMTEIYERNLNVGAEADDTAILTKASPDLNHNIRVELTVDIVTKRSRRPTPRW